MSTEGIKNDTVRVAKNTGFIIAGKIAYYAIAVFANLLLIRYLGSTRFGKFSVVYAYLLFFDILTWIGIDRVVVRDIARAPSRIGTLLGNALLFRFSMSIIGVLASWLILLLMDYPPDIRHFIYIASLALMMRPGTLFETMYKVELKMALPTIIDVVVKLAHAALIILLIILEARLVLFIVLNLILAAPAFVAKWYYSRKYVHLDFRFDLSLWKELFSESWPLAISSVFIMIFTRIDQLMIFRILDAKAVGLYSAAVRITESMCIIPVAFMTSVFPLISRLFKESRDVFQKAYYLSFRYLLIIAIPVVVAITLLAREIVILLIGHQFLPCTGALTILAWSEIFVFTGSVSGPVLLAMHLQRIDMCLTMGMAAINIILNLWLIPRLGISGAAIATTISYGASLLAGCFIPKLRAIALAAIKSMVKPLLASAAMGLCIIWLRPLVSLLLIVPLAVVIYLALLIAVRGITAEDWKLFKVIIPRKRRRDG